MHTKKNYVSINNMEFKIDPQYEVIERIISTNGIDDIKAISLNYVNYEVLRL